jgi:signal transduction histidine kinase
VAGLLAWDTQRATDAATRRLARTHTLLASVLARDLSHRLASVDPSGPDVEAERTRVVEEALSDTSWNDDPSQTVALARIPPRTGFVLPRGGLVSCTALDAAFERGESDLVLTREQAASLGLGSRIAVAGLARVDAAGGRSVRLVVAGTARFERDAFRHARYRALAGLATALLLVASFGTLVLREQRREHDLSTRLADEKRERERDDELARSNRLASLAALSLGIGHELSTPLGVILGRVEQLSADSDLAPRNRKALLAIEGQVVRIRSVLQGFLSLARGDAPIMERVRLADVARAALALVDHRFTSVHVRLTSKLDDRVLVACDASLLGQVVINLLVNAASASPAGSSVHVVVAERDRQAVLEVTDEGLGISDESSRRATEPFFTTRAHVGGSGLGLSIAREIVSHHGGELSVVALATSAGGGRGTVASVRLPRVVEPKEEHS